MCIVAAAAVICFSISSRLLPSSDDLFYLFVYDDSNFEDASLLQHIDSWADIARSQTWHYLHVNGRAPIHIAVQAFAGLWGYKVFGIVNALIFALFLFLIVRISFPTPARFNPWAWLATLIALLYLFPGGLNSLQGPWFGIAIGINYLWAGVLFIGSILTFNRCRLSHAPLNLPLAILLGALGFFTGWSNEAYALPLSGALFFYILFNRRKLNIHTVLMAITLWIGTALLVLAPGTFERAAEHNSHGVTDILTTLAECYLKAWPVMICAIIALLAFISKRVDWRQFVTDNYLPVVALLLALPFSIYAHSGPHSLTAINLLCLIVTIKLVYTLYPRLNRKASIKSLVAAAVIVGLLIWHQVAIYRASTLEREKYLQTASNFIQSPDGVFAVTPSHYGPLIDQFVYRYLMNLHPGSTYSYPFAAWTGRTDLLPMQLTPQQYDNLIANPHTFFNTRRPIDGSAHMFEMEGFYILPIDHASTHKDDVVTAYFGNDFMKSLPFYRRWVHALMGNRKPPKQLNSYTIHTLSGDYLIAEKILSTPNRIDLQPTNP